MRVVKDKCIGCGTCFAVCPVEAIDFDDGGNARINKEICIKCGGCKGACPMDAITENDDEEKDIDIKN